MVHAISDRVIETERLIFDRWTAAHRDAAAAMNADPVVMTYFLAPMSRAETDEQVDRQELALASRGFCFWPVIRREDGIFLGIAGLKEGAADTPIAGEVEVGWRFARHAWGRGYATEAAAAALRHGFADASVRRIAAITSAGNIKSLQVMQRLGMHRDFAADFDHPALPEGHPWRPHITWYIDRD